MESQIVLFDINETVLDLSLLKPAFLRIFGTEGALPFWFVKLLHTSNVCVVTKVTSDFASLASIALEQVASFYKVVLSEQDKAALLDGLACLAPHPDVKPALKRLRDHGFQVVAFSNSSSALITKQIMNAKLDEHFDNIISVEGAGSFKPDPAVYRYASELLAVPRAQLRLVACHDWDTHAALFAGLKAAYIARGQSIYNPLYLQPDIQETSMDAIAQQIISAAN